MESGDGTEPFTFGLYETDGTQHGGDKSSDTPDGTGHFGGDHWDLPLTNPDGVLNKTGTTTLELRVTSDVTADPAAYTWTEDTDPGYVNGWVLGVPDVSLILEVD